MSYLDYWQLAQSPFAEDHRPESFLASKNSALVAGRLRFALGRPGGVAGLYGASGTGKTYSAMMLIREFQAANWLASYLPSPAATPGDLNYLFRQAAGENPAEAGGLGELGLFLSRLAGEGRYALLVVDDVQSSRNPDFLEMLRTLLNIERDGVPALSLLLVGQNAMERSLERASDFQTRLAAKAVLTPLTPEEAKVYILARLKNAGSRQGIFTRQAAERVVEIAGGVPRQINRLCDLALVIGFGLSAKKLDPTIISMAAADLDLLPPADTPFFAWSLPRPPAPPAGEEKVAPDPVEDILAGLAEEKASAAPA
ncbi:MAG: AAA family ATPase [Planctomycetota bacterium]|jgi:type II secretory pathway predicted ATPase ExeA|nr:AAA family ATPase [Planctomycetota bacterium]